jgi:hypothetical protein
VFVRATGILLPMLARNTGIRGFSLRLLVEDVWASPSVNFVGDCSYAIALRFWGRKRAWGVSNGRHGELSPNKLCALSAKQVAEGADLRSLRCNFLFCVRPHHRCGERRSPREREDLPVSAAEQYAE